MNPLYTTSIKTPYGDKCISAFCCDITSFDEDIDILTASAFVGSYTPSPRTLFRALYNIGISAEYLSHKPEIDLRSLCKVWLSKEIPLPETRIHRLGCIEFINGDDYFRGIDLSEQTMLNSIKSYFQMLDIAATYDIKMDTIALPLLAGGNQNISAELTIIPIINECLSFLNRNSSVKSIYFIERNPEKAAIIADALKTSYRMLAQKQEHSVEEEEKEVTCQANVFISHSSEDKNIADNLCSKLERKGIKVWYAPRDVKGPYAAAIAEAISKATHFIIILSENSMKSQHVLSEIDLAFQGLPDNIKFKPLRIDESLFTPSFKYYLSRQHWMDAIIPPLEKRLDEFVEKFLEDL